MADFNELKDMVLGAIGNVADMTKDVAGRTADRAKGMARIAKLNMEINGEKDVIKKAYMEIGKLYYETHSDDPDGFFTQLCDEINLATDNIAAKASEITEIKAGMKDEYGIDVEFEEVEAEEEDFACDCGCAEHAKDVVVDIKDAAKEAAGEVKDAAQDVAEDVTNAAKEAAEEARDFAGEVKEEASEAKETVKVAVKKVAGIVSDAAHEVAGAVKEAVEDIKDSGQDS